MREPAFWWRPAGLQASLLAPVAAIYGTIAERRMARAGCHAPVPVVCIGNLTLGGTGKTPLASTVARMLVDMGEKPTLLSRGYGGTLAGPHKVDPAADCATDVGDEPLLLARVAPTIVARERVAGAYAAVAAGATAIVMDDGFQNPSLAKDVCILVADARRGIGNGRVFPAGPLRAPYEAQLRQARALVVVGRGEGGAALAATARACGLTVLGAQLVPDLQVVATLRDAPVLAFAGIGDPEKFFATLRASGIDVGATRSFPDHHRYRREEAQALCAAAKRESLVLVTTEKDIARMQGVGETAELATAAHALPVTLVLDDEPALRALLQTAVAARKG